ncbi:hypothetical protein B0T18DRAFT_417316 [Schizothecium vesticola]|uniref:Uncharacterized protein n=1 Tax=Schizothecium vesticola TaxID=314040 RepID=A0AA40JYK2_9PEZI|nr:hypothetical protein B0T18DRAFT_417316 [Schizothecium vesticola]
MHAYYSDKSEYLCHRVAQAWEFATLLNEAERSCHRGVPVLRLGNFNAEPDSLPVRVIRARAKGMRDAWVEGRRQQGGVREEGIEEGATYGSPYNTWFWTKEQRARHLAYSATDQLRISETLVETGGHIS